MIGVYHRTPPSRSLRLVKWNTGIQGHMKPGRSDRRTRPDLPRRNGHRWGTQISGSRLVYLPDCARSTRWAESAALAKPAEHSQAVRPRSCMSTRKALVPRLSSCSFHLYSRLRRTPNSRARSAAGFPDLSINLSASRLNSDVNCLRFLIEHLLRGVCPLSKVSRQTGANSDFYGSTILQESKDRGNGDRLLFR